MLRLRNPSCFPALDGARTDAEPLGKFDLREIRSLPRLSYVCSKLLEPIDTQHTCAHYRR